MEELTLASGPYEPVSCELYDTLEAIAVQRRKVAIEVNCRGGATSTRVASIRDLYTQGGVEYALLDSGEVVRLDAVAAVDGVDVAQIG
jgi:Rho-binding antiterminator